MAKQTHTTYKFKIENESHEWPNQFITGVEVRSVPPGIPDNMDLYVKETGKTGRLVKNDDRIDLSDKGVEKFYSQDTNSGAGI